MALAAELNGYIQNYQRLRGYASAMRSGEHGHDHAGHGEQ
jgi:hypothetical protein